MAKVVIESNGSDGMAMSANTYWKASTLWNLGNHDEHVYEGDTVIDMILSAY